MNANGPPSSLPTTTLDSGATSEFAGSGKRRPAVNISPVERAGRIVLGLAAIIAGVVLLVSAGSTLAIVLEVLLIAAGLDLVVTGALGHCPLYQRLGHVPTSLRGSA